MKKRSRKDKRKQFVASRRGVIMIAVIAMLVLIINIISASYSWFTPQNVNGTGMEYQYQGKARSENCRMNTYRGEKVTSANKANHSGYYLNQIDYTKPYGTNGLVTGSQTIDKATTVNGKIVPTIGYFKTEIINNDTKYASCVSLYVTTMPVCTLAVTYPSNSVRSMTANNGLNNQFIIRNAYVKRKDVQDVNGPGLLVVEWFVANYNTSSSISINVSNLYLTYS